MQNSLDDPITNKWVIDSMRLQQQKNPASQILIGVMNSTNAVDQFMTIREGAEGLGRPRLPKP